MASDLWLRAFPLPQAAKAVDAVILSWQRLASVQRPEFNHSTIEPRLTLVLASYLREVVAYERKIPGFWGAEDVKARVDFSTGEIISSTRTDIEYLWMHGSRRMQLVFEFKRLDGGAASLEHYCGVRGLGRFVTGDYSVHECVALMAGIALKDRRALISAIRTRFEDEGPGGVLRMKKAGTKLLRTPSEIFPGRAEFDTEHVRDKSKAPAHGTIRVSHLFLDFGYEAKTPGKRRGRRRQSA